MSRSTSSGAFIPEIDGLRFVAIMAVIVFHLSDRYFVRPGQPFWMPNGDVIGWVTYTGHFGVQLFFVISGFVLALPFAQEQLPGGRQVMLKNYYLRRFTRLHPPYVISLLIFFAVAVIGKPGVVFSQLSTYIEHLFAHGFYLHRAFYGPIGTPGYFSINTVAWSLEVEVQFYLIAPLLALLFRVRSNHIRRLLLIISILGTYGMMFFLPRPPISYTVIPYLYYFLLGFLLTDIYVTAWHNRAPKKSAMWDIIGIMAWLVGPFMVGLGHTRILVAVGLILLAYIAAFRGILLSRLFSNRLIVSIGGMCYTIYLYHTLLFDPLNTLSDWIFGLPADRLAVPIDQIIMRVAVSTVLIVAFSAVLFVLFEKPFMKSRRRAS